MSVHNWRGIGFRVWRVQGSTLTLNPKSGSQVDSDSDIEVVRAPAGQLDLPASPESRAKLTDLGV